MTEPLTTETTRVRSRFRRAVSRLTTACASAARACSTRDWPCSRVSCATRSSQLDVAARFALRLVQGGLRGLLGGVRLAQGQLEAGAVDFEQDVAGLDLLVVVHEDFGHLAGDVGRDLHDIGLDAAVAGPGFDFVVAPQLPAGIDGAGGWRAG